MTEEINDLIKEFKPFHSNVKNISYASLILDTVRIDSNISLNIINQYQDVTTIGYYPIDQEINEFQKRKKSESIRVRIILLTMFLLNIFTLHL